MKKIIDTNEIVNQVTQTKIKVLINTAHIVRAWPCFEGSRIELVTGAQIDLELSYKTLLEMLWS